MAPSVPATEVHFYTADSYAGDPHAYKLGDDANLYPGALNDKFRSAAVGSGAKVLAWQHASSSSSPSGAGVYAELTGDVPSLAFLGGLTRFKVVEADARAIAFRFVDATSTTGSGSGGEPRRYSLKVDAADVGEKVLVASGGGGGGGDDNDDDDDDDFQLVGIIREDGPPVTTAVYVRDEKTGVYIAVGSIFFQWNAKEKQVDIAEDDNFPKQLSADRAGPSKFVIKLVSNEPST